jgi:cytochrome c peroxidase
MSSRKSAVFLSILGLLIVASVLGQEQSSRCGHGSLSPLESLGKYLFLDARLSSPTGMSCASCHGPSVGFTGDDESVNAGGAVYPGAVPTRFGNRKPPAAAYAGASPVLTYDDSEGVWVGGMFWDGRASGWTLGDPLAEQAQGPFLNPLEHNLPDAHPLCVKVKHSRYASLFKRVWHLRSIDCVNNTDQVYEQIGRSIAAYERSEEVSPYNSKYDAYLAGDVDLTAEERWGLALFEGKAECANCHPSSPGPDGAPPQFTDFTYDNLGVPKNEDNPFYTMPPEWNPDGSDWIDVGFGGFLESAGFAEEIYEPEIGKHKVPTLRNVDLRPTGDFIKAYGHNGYFKSLEEVVHFYNTRDVDGAGWRGEPWPAPEVSANINTAEMGDLGLTEDEEAAVVAFLRTLSDSAL